jgi:site-specific recombinase XerD
MKAAKTARRRTWAEMDHDDALLLEEIVRRSRVEERGPIAEFLAKKQAEQERQTSSNYRTALLRFHAFLGEDATVGDVNEAAGFRYLEHLRAQGLADNSIATYIKAVKVFTRWMHKKGWTERDRFEDVKQPPFVRPKFDTLSPEHKQAILGAFDPQTFLGARNLAIVCVFLDTGIRREELAHLEEARVHLSASYVEVYSEKTDEWRIVPLSGEAAAACQNYLKWRTRLFEKPVRRRAAPYDSNHRRKAPRTLSTTKFFCSGEGAPLSADAVGLIVRRLRERLAADGVKLHLNVAAHPTAAWVWRQLIEATPWGRQPRYLLRDRDAVYGGDFVPRARRRGIRTLLSPVRAPRANAIAERVVRTLRDECLDRLVILNERPSERCSRSSSSTTTRTVHIGAWHWIPPGPRPAPPPARSTRGPCLASCSMSTSAPPDGRTSFAPPQVIRAGAGVVNMDWLGLAVQRRPPEQPGPAMTATLTER